MVENFDSRAASWDDDPARLSRARQVAETIKANLPLTGRPITVELGAGTGLLSRCLADVLGPTTLLDSSPAMVEAASKALAAAGLKDWNAAVADLSEGIPGGPYELVLAQLFLHHVDDVPALLRALRRFVTPEGVVVIADHDHDADGLYHSTSVDFHGHHGFRRDELRGWLEEAGYRDISFHDAGVANKKVVGGQRLDFPLFLAIARH